MHKPFKFFASTLSLSALTAMVLALPSHAQTPTSPQEGASSASSEPNAAAPASTPAHESIAAPAQPTPPEPTRTELQAYTSANHLTTTLKSWSEVGVRGTHTTGAHVLSGEVASTRRFGETGTYFGIGDSYTFNPDWFGSLSIGAGDGASYLPDGRVDVFINRKLLPNRNLITTVGAGYYSAPDGHSDRNISLGATHYFDKPLILQGEIRINLSRPGNVKTRQQFLALTYGRAQFTQVTARYAWGREGYLSIGNGNTLVNFSSHQSSLTLRHWLEKDWGLTLGLEQYHNPFYERTGVTLGLFWEPR